MDATLKLVGEIETNEHRMSIPTDKLSIIHKGFIRDD
jgi:hypothetical protein